MNGWMEISEGMAADYRGTILLCTVGGALIGFARVDPPTGGLYAWALASGYTHWQPAPAPLTPLDAARKWARDGHLLCQAVEEEATAGRSVRPVLKALQDHIAAAKLWADHFGPDVDDGN